MKTLSPTPGSTARTAEDARRRPIPGDRYYYRFGGGYDEILEVDGDRVLVGFSDDAEACWAKVRTWAYGPGTWVPA